MSLCDIGGGGNNSNSHGPRIFETLETVEDIYYYKGCVFVVSSRKKHRRSVWECCW